MHVNPTLFRILANPDYLHLIILGLFNIWELTVFLIKLMKRCWHDNDNDDVDEDVDDDDNDSDDDDDDDDDDVFLREM